MYNWLKGGTGERVCLLGGSGLGYLFPKGLGQATLQELSACPELLIILGVFRALMAALIKDRHLPSSLVLAQRGYFGACEKENTPLDVISTRWKTVNWRFRVGKTTWDSLVFPQNII